MSSSFLEVLVPALYTHSATPQDFQESLCTYIMEVVSILSLIIKEDHSENICTPVSKNYNWHVPLRNNGKLKFIEGSQHLVITANNSAYVRGFNWATVAG